MITKAISAFIRSVWLQRKDVKHLKSEVVSDSLIAPGDRCMGLRV